MEHGSRIPQDCPPPCPGCRYRALSPAESRARKEAWASSCLAPWGSRIAPLREPSARWGYRRKALLHARLGPDGWHFGLLRRFGPQRREAALVAIPDCPLHEPALNARLMVLRTLIPRDMPLAFVQASGTLFTLILKCAPDSAWREQALAWEPPLRAAGLAGLQINWNPAAGRRAVSSRHQEIVFGPALVEEAGILHGALSFRQQIPEIETAALDLAEAFLAEAKATAAVDLYSGAGGSLRRWEARGWRTVGVELGGEACRAASRNAPSAQILKGKAEQRLPQIREFLGGEGFVVYTNPPRDGHHALVTAWLLEARPRRVAYLSCNPKSLARDLELLGETYAVRELRPFDFFPQTDHVECLALLERVG